uniref:flagellin N-terminal helical domain-containing protein n=1 Tax=Polynucleobacter sp. TaxID=2029855 RepID=UPI00404763DB
MAAVINTNMASLQAQNQLSRTTASLNNTIQQLSSGLRVNSAADDASGYAISKNMDSVIRGSTVAIRNANDAISFSQTATGALDSLSNLLGRMRELATQSANQAGGIINSELLQTEFASLKAEVTRTINSTKFNSVSTFGATTFNFQIGSGTSSSLDQVSLTTTALSAAATLAAGTAYIIGAGNTGVPLGKQLVLAAEAAAAVSGATGLSVRNAVEEAALAITVHASDTGTMTEAEKATLVNEINSITATAATSNAATVLASVRGVYGNVAGDGTYTVSAVTGGSIAAGTLKSVALTASLGATEALAGTASSNSTAAITQIDAAITAVNTEAATHGAFQNKLGFVTDNLSSLIQTTSAAKSRVVDTDFAAQTAQLSKYQILQQAGTAMLAQANQMGSNVLTLLK